MGTAAPTTSLPSSPTASTSAHPELADLFRLSGKAYFQKYPASPSQYRVMKDILLCRTAALGGHQCRCDHCGYEHPSYNSCLNRHCPKCGSLKKARWLHQQQSELLDIGYFHLVFTLPHRLNPLIRANRLLLYNLFFQAVSATLLAFGQTRLGGLVGFVVILHTWTQLLLEHFHLHCLMPAGALVLDPPQWKPCSLKFIFPVQALSLVFRAKFLQGLEKLYRQGQLKFPADGSASQSLWQFKQLLRSTCQSRWVVYAKKPFGSPLTAMDYLGRYTQRVAFSNHRLLSLSTQKVRFQYRDRRDNDKSKETELDPIEFIRRFFLHLLPSHFMRVRHFGFWANRSKKKMLPLCRQLLDQPEPELPDLDAYALMEQLTGKDFSLCPQCHQGKLLIVAILPPQLEEALLPWLAITPRLDSS
jgi:hypothetical protein